jgi:hypothetical protein
VVARLRYEGHRDSSGHDVHFNGDPDVDSEDFHIVPRGGAQIPVTIDGVDESVFEAISKINSCQSSEVTEFCDTYGLPAKGEKLSSDHFREQQIELISMLELAAEEDWASLGRAAAKILNAQSNDPEAQYFDVRRVPGASHPRLLIATHDLFVFAALQACAAISEGQKIKQCQSCKGFFAVGPNTGRKQDALYCSGRCRMAAHRARA